MYIPTVALAPDGNSHFCETEMTMERLDFAPPSPGGYTVSPLMSSGGVRLLDTPAGYVDDWHPVPYPMLVFILSGKIRIETSDGDR